VLAVLVFLTLAIVHLEELLAMAFTLSVFATALAVCLVLLMVYDRPFGSGGSTVPATLLRDVMPD
jgi:hypothetical protein